MILSRRSERWCLKIFTGCNGGHFRTGYTGDDVCRGKRRKKCRGGLTNPDYEVNQQIFDSSAAGADTATEAVSIYHALKTGQSADNSYIGYEQHGLYNNHALDFHETDVNKQMIPMSQTTIVPNDDMEEEKDSPDDDAGEDTTLPDNGTGEEMMPSDDDAGKEETPPGDGTGEDTTLPDAPVDDPSDSDMSDEEENPSETDQDNTAADDEDESDVQDDPADDTEAPETSIKPEKAVKGDDCG